MRYCTALYIAIKVVFWLAWVAIFIPSSKHAKWPSWMPRDSPVSGVALLFVVKYALISIYVIFDSSIEMPLGAWHP